MAASADDAAAIACATVVAAPTGGRVAGVTIGDGDASWALARGAAQVDSVADVPALDDDVAIASALAAAVRQTGPFDLVVMGDAAQEHPGVAGALAGLLGLPALLGVDDVAVEDDDAGRAVVHRTAGEEIETLSVAMPALVSVAAVAAEKKTPGMKELLAARKRPVHSVAAAEVGAPVDDRLTVEESRTPEQHGARLFEGEPAETARALLAALQGEGAL